jgi:hypothetical protein
MNNNWCEDFKKWIQRVAIDNLIPLDTACELWRQYTKTCEGYDQSPSTGEFLRWNKFNGEPI